MFPEGLTMIPEMESLCCFFIASGELVISGDVESLGNSSRFSDGVGGVTVV